MNSQRRSIIEEGIYMLEISDGHDRVKKKIDLKKVQQAIQPR